MIVMKKKVTTSVKKPNRTDEVSVQFYADRETVEALNAYLESLSTLAPDQRSSKKGILLTALRNYLQSKGAWPPKPEQR